MLSVTCPECKLEHDLGEHLAGMRIHCKRCPAWFDVPPNTYGETSESFAIRAGAPEPTGTQYDDRIRAFRATRNEPGDAVASSVEDIEVASAQSIADDAPSTDDNGIDYHVDSIALGIVGLAISWSLPWLPASPRLVVIMVILQPIAFGTSFYGTLRLLITSWRRRNRRMFCIAICILGALIGYIVLVFQFSYVFHNIANQPIPAPKKPAAQVLNRKLHFTSSQMPPSVPPAPPAPSPDPPPHSRESRSC